MVGRRSSDVSAKGKEIILHPKLARVVNEKHEKAKRETPRIPMEVLQTVVVKFVDDVKTVASITLAAGLVFQLPVLVFFLSKAGLVTAPMLKSYRRHALVGILALSAVITPPDVTSQILVSMPVLLLYEMGIWIARRQDKRRAR